MGTTETKRPLSILQEDFQARPVVWVIDGMRIKPAYVTRHPESIHADMEVVFQSITDTLADLPFGPLRTQVNAWDVKETEGDADRELLARCWREASRLARKLTGAEL